MILVATLVLGLLLPQIRADLEIRHEALARAIAGQVETYLLGARRELRAVAEDLRDHQHDLPASHWFGHLDAHAGTGHVFAAIYITDSDDSVYSVGLPQSERGQRGELLGLDLSKRAALREARERNEEAWSETFLSAVTGRLAVTLAIPVAGQVLVGEIAIDQLSEFIRRSPAESGLLTIILDRQGQIIAHSQAALSGQQLSLGHLPIVRDALEGRFATRGFEWDGGRFVGTSVGVPQLGWIVLVAQPRSEAFRPFLFTLWVLAAGALVALPLAILVAWALSRGFARRIGRYAKQAHAIAEGDYDQPWPNSRIREFDGLASDLDRMSLAIRQRERDLATSEARFRSVINNAPVVLFQFDEHGIFTFSEGKGLAGIGLAAGEAVGRSVFELYRDYPEVCDHARRTLNGESVRFNARIGEVFLDVYASPVRDGGGHLQVMGVTVDITERQRAEEALRLTQFSVDRASDSILWVDDEGKLVYANDAACASLGYGREDLLSMKVFDIDPDFPPDGFEEHKVELRRRGAMKFESRHRTKDGRLFPVEVTTNYLEHNGHFLGCAFVRDIGERKAAEEALRASEALLAKTTADAPAMIYQFLLRPDGTSCFPYASAWCREMFGVPPETLRESAAPLLDRILPEDRSGFEESVAFSARTLEPWRHEYRLRSARGDIVWHQGISRPERQADGGILWSGIFFDTTERKRTEEELQRYREHLEELVAERTAELRQAMNQLVQSEKLAALGQLVAGVAHELNTPLGNARVIAGALGEHLREFAAAAESGALRRSQLDAFLARGREAVAILERNAARAADLLGHFKQVAVDQTSARRRRFSLRQTVEELLATLQPQFKRTAYRVELDIPPDIELDSYPGPLEQVFANLVSNSLIHGFAGIEAGVIRISAAARDDDHTQIDYADDGVGIPETLHSRIFDPFFTTRMGQGGSGLGLYIVYNLVTGALGGTIQVRRQPGQGAAFTLILPRTAPDRTASD